MVCAAAGSAFADVEVQFLSSTATVKQGARVVELPVILYNNGGSDQTVQLSCPTADGSAKQNVNYRGGSPAIENIVVPGQTTVQVNVPIGIILAKIRRDTFFTVSLNATGTPTPQIHSPSSMVVRIKGLPERYFKLRHLLREIIARIHEAHDIQDDSTRKRLLAYLLSRREAVRHHMNLIAR